MTPNVRLANHTRKTFAAIAPPSSLITKQQWLRPKERYVATELIVWESSQPDRGVRVQNDDASFATRKAHGREEDANMSVERRKGRQIVSRLAV